MDQIGAGIHFNRCLPPSSVPIAVEKQDAKRDGPYDRNPFPTKDRQSRGVLVSKRRILFKENDRRDMVVPPFTVAKNIAYLIT
jgi:hypothetical protein